MPGPGSWYVYCKSDPRWNGEGRSRVVDGLLGCREMDDHIKKCKELYGDPPPDATMGCMKD